MDNHKPTVIMRQAPMTIKLYMTECVEMLDEQFGEGYAKNNPELLASMIQSCTQDFFASMISSIVEENLGRF